MVECKEIKKKSMTETKDAKRIILKSALNKLIFLILKYTKRIIVGIKALKKAIVVVGKSRYLMNIPVEPHIIVAKITAI